VIASWLFRREQVFFIVTGLAEGIMTALTLAAGKILDADSMLTIGLAVRIGLASGFPTAVVFFAAEYARQRGYLLRMARQLNLTEHGRLVSGTLGRQAVRESLGSAAVSGFCSFAGASIPLGVAAVMPGPGWPSVVIAVGCLGLLGAGIGYTVLSCKTCWALALVIAGSLMAVLGFFLRVV
jgi:VIT1/CCC1 family predicted Fe2+/Mn2+ transporter